MHIQQIILKWKLIINYINAFNNAFRKTMHIFLRMLGTSEYSKNINRKLTLLALTHLFGIFVRLGQGKTNAKGDH
jgi:hypothetical protein